MKKFLLGSVALVALAAVGSATAADMPVKAPAPVVYNWSGCYVGGNVGYGRGRNQASAPTLPGVDLGSNTGTGIAGGSQIGCDYQFGSWVFGARGMLDWTNVKGSHRPVGPGFTANETLEFKTQWFGTLSGRIGYAVQPQWLAYLTGGAAWVRNSYTDADPTFATPYVGQANATRNGWVIGGGLEYKFQRNWSLFAEYNYIELGGRDVTLFYNTNAVVNPFTYHFKQNLQTILVGLNYRFGG